MCGGKKGEVFVVLKISTGVCYMSEDRMNKGWFSSIPVSVLVVKSGMIKAVSSKSRAVAPIRQPQHGFSCGLNSACHCGLASIHVSALSWPVERRGAESAAVFLHPLSFSQLSLTHRFSRYQHKSVLNAHLRLRLSRDERIAICPGFILGCEGQWCSSRSSALAQTRTAGPCYFCHQHDTYRMIVSVLSLCYKQVSAFLGTYMSTGRRQSSWRPSTGE